MRVLILWAWLVAALALGYPQAAAAGSPELIQSLRLPADLANQTALTALHSCGQQGSAVSVSLVDSHGVLQVFLQGDGAAPHTAELSRHKAYTAVSLAALQGLHTTAELADALRKANAPIGMLPLPADAVEGITPVAGGVVLRSHQQALIGGLGVSGARQGQMDERCALEAEAWLLGQLQAQAGATS